MLTRVNISSNRIKAATASGTLSALQQRRGLPAIACVNMHTGFQPRKEIHRLMAARRLDRFSRWFQRSSAGGYRGEGDRSERNGLLRSHLDQVVPVMDSAATSKALAVHVEPKTVALKVSIHCYGCARKVEKQVSKLQGVVSFKVELESKRLTVVGNVSPTEVLECVCKVTKHAEILQAP